MVYVCPSRTAQFDTQFTEILQPDQQKVAVLFDALKNQKREKKNMLHSLAEKN